MFEFDAFSFSVALAGVVVGGALLVNMLNASANINLKCTDI